MSDAHSTPYDLVSLGENMLRLSPPGHERLAQAMSLEMRFGGAESNVAVLLTRLGFRTAWLSRVPDHALGQRLVADLRQHGVDVDGVRMVPGERLGTYYIEQGAAPRPNRVIYDRANSAASRMQLEDVDLSRIDAARWVHLTGITAALSDGCRTMVGELARRASARGATVSFDVNYRALLWTPAQAREGLAPILPHCHVLFSAHRDAVAIFGVSGDPLQAARELQAQYGCATVVLTTGEEGAVAIQAGPPPVAVNVPGFKVSTIVDRVGAGDAFDAGFIASQLRGRTLADSLRYGHACSALKITIPGDHALLTADEIDLLLQGSALASLR